MKCKKIYEMPHEKRKKENKKARKFSPNEKISEPFRSKQWVKSMLNRNGAPHCPQKREGLPAPGVKMHQNFLRCAAPQFGEDEAMQLQSDRMRAVRWRGQLGAAVGCTAGVAGCMTGLRSTRAKMCQKVAGRFVRAPGQPDAVSGD